MADSVNSTALPNAPSSIVPFTFESIEVRLIDRDGVPWWVLVDVCRVLEIGNPSQAATRLDDDEKTTLTNNEGHAGNGAQTFIIINESGLYSLILTSRKPAAKRFKKWVTSEVLPLIRRTGAYGTPPPTKTTSFPVTRDTTIIRFPEVHRRTGYHRTWLFRLEREGKFPKRVQLGTKSVGWIEEEVMAWIAGRQEGRSGEALPWLLVPPGGQVPAQAAPVPAPEPVQAPTKRKRGRPPRLPAAPPLPSPRVERQAAPVDRPSLAADLLNGPDKIAAFLGLTVQQILTFASRNQIPAFWVGAQLLARKSTLTRWVADAEAAAFRTMAEVAELERHAAGTESPTPHHLSRQGDAP